MKKKDNTFSGLRFIACFCVFTLHCYSSKMSFFAAWGVSLFFMMSGFLYGKKYADHSLEIRETVPFFLKKLKKIYPLFCFTTCLALPYFIIGFGWEEVVRQAIPCFLLLQAFFCKYNAVLIASTWFVSAILFLYVLTPLLVTAAKKMMEKMGQIGTIVFGIFCMILLIGYSKCMYDSGADIFWIYNFAPVRIVEYYIAICVGMFAGKKESVVSKNIRTEVVCADVMIAATFLIIAICGFSFWISPVYWRDALWIVPNCFLLYFADKNIGIVAKILCWRPLVSLGKISFEIYLFHPIFFVYSSIYNEFWDSARIWRICCFILIFILTVISSYLWEKIFVQRKVKIL